MTQIMLFGSGTGTRTSYQGHGINTNPPPSSRGSVGVMFTRFLTRKLLSCPGVEKDGWRDAVTRYLLKARNIEACIDEILSLCTTQGGPEGLDTAIDILSSTGELILQYGWDYLQRDIVNWTPDSERAYKPNDDCWYILLRAIGRTDASAIERFRFITCCANADSRGIREGVVEGLRDLRTQKAKELLRNLAKIDPDRYIREIAQEALDDLES